MSEYQYYEFAAVDRPLDPDDLAQVRALSTRAHMTPTSFVNEYEWGDFRGDPQHLVEQYYDAFFYLANWGTHQLMLRFPTALLAASVVERYCDTDEVASWESGDHVIIAAVSEDEDREFEWDGEVALGPILPVRAEILGGDLRALYLLWLLAVGYGTVDDDVLEPPVPAGLATLTGSQTALVDFLRIDRDLLAVAAAGSGAVEEAVGPDIERWVADLSAEERDTLLVGLLRGDDAHLRAKTLRRMSPLPAAGERTGRTAGALVEAATARRAERERAEKERREREQAENARRAAEAERQRREALVAEGERAWVRVATRIAEKKPAAYDVAVGLLLDLQEVTEGVEFGRRVEDLKEEHRRRPGLLGRLAAAGL
jgi:hypothetical protein